MTFKKLTAGVWVSPQITETDKMRAAKEDFRAIIDNRPDGREWMARPHLLENTNGARLK